MHNVNAAVEFLNITVACRFDASALHVRHSCPLYREVAVRCPWRRQDVNVFDWFQVAHEIIFCVDNFAY